MVASQATSAPAPVLALHSGLRRPAAGMAEFSRVALRKIAFWRREGRITALVARWRTAWLRHAVTRYARFTWTAERAEDWRNAWGRGM
ncbi:hypothetical protein [Terricaulis silvestris]|uniref:hypothetical protein n=1 Tax=Terricaulis silvestris TaxID=2686094 RepID=UPI00131E692C|nr:hypothetical protein [Terricaulis silvestris]